MKLSETNYKDTKFIMLTAHCKLKCKVNPGIFFHMLNIDPNVCSNVQLIRDKKKSNGRKITIMENCPKNYTYSLKRGSDVKGIQITKKKTLNNNSLAIYIIINKKPIYMVVYESSMTISGAKNKKDVVDCVTYCKLLIKKCNNYYNLFNVFRINYILKTMDMCINKLQLNQSNLNTEGDPSLCTSTNNTNSVDFNIIIQKFISIVKKENITEEIISQLYIVYNDKKYNSEKEDGEKEDGEKDDSKKDDTTSSEMSEMSNMIQKFISIVKNENITDEIISQLYNTYWLCPSFTRHNHLGMPDIRETLVSGQTHCYKDNKEDLPFEIDTKMFEIFKLEYIIDIMKIFENFKLEHIINMTSMFDIFRLNHIIGYVRMLCSGRPIVSEELINENTTHLSDEIKFFNDLCEFIEIFITNYDSFDISKEIIVQLYELYHQDINFVNDLIEIEKLNYSLLRCNFTFGYKISKIKFVSVLSNMKIENLRIFYDNKLNPNIILSYITPNPECPENKKKSWYAKLNVSHNGTIMISYSRNPFYLHKIIFKILKNIDENYSHLFKITK